MHVLINKFIATVYVNFFFGLVNSLLSRTPNEKNVVNGTRVHIFSFKVSFHYL